MTSRRLTRGITAVAALAGLTLAGCAANPGAAAVVDGQRISESYVADAVADFYDVTGQPIDASAMLGTLVVSPIILSVAKDNGVAASDEEAADLLDQQAEINGLPEPEETYSDGVLQVARVSIVNQELTTSPDVAGLQEEIADRIESADVDVSPRYGEFDPAGQIIPLALPWITPAPAA